MALIWLASALCASAADRRLASQLLADISANGDIARSNLIGSMGGANDWEAYWEVARAGSRLGW